MACAYVCARVWPTSICVLQGVQGSHEEMESMIPQTSTPRLRRCGYCLLQVTNCCQLPTYARCVFVFVSDMCDFSSLCSHIFVHCGGTSSHHVAWCVSTVSQAVKDIYGNLFELTACILLLLSFYVFTEFRFVLVHMTFSPACQSLVIKCYKFQVARWCSALK